MNYFIFYMIAVLLLVASSSYARRHPRVHPRGRAALRVHEGYNDTDGRYPYVVALVTKTLRHCTGSVIASNWVLTAAHCQHPQVVAIQYGDMTVPPEQSITKRNIIQFIKPIASIIKNIGRNEILKHDIALVKVEEVRMGVYGRMNSVDYRTLIGLEIEYAGYGLRSFTLSSMKEMVKMPLQLGAGIVSPCPEKYMKNIGPYICVSRRCGSAQYGLEGDSGGPLVYDGKIVGVYSAASIRLNIQGYFPVSPYLEWMHNTMATYMDGN